MKSLLLEYRLRKLENKYNEAKYGGIPAVILTDKKDSDHKFVYTISSDDIVFYELNGRKILRTKKFDDFTRKYTLGTVLWELDR